MTSRSSTIPTGGISPNCPFETAAPNCTERMPIRTSDTGEKRAAGTGSGYKGLAGASARLAHLSGMATPVHRQTRSHSSSKYGLDPVITMSQLASQLGVSVQTLYDVRR